MHQGTTSSRRPRDSLLTDDPIGTFCFEFVEHSVDKNWYRLNQWFNESEMKDMIARINAFPKIMEFINELKTSNQNMWKDIDIAKKLEDIIKEEKIKASRMSVPK